MDVGDDDEGSLTNASLAVHLSDTVGETMNITSFMAPSLLDSSMSTSPLSSSRSAPPDLPTIPDQDSPQNKTDSILYPYPNQFQTSTPICSNATSRRRGGGENVSDMNFTTGEAPTGAWDSTIYQEDPTNIMRANRAFRVDDDDSANQNSNEIGFMSTKESGICDMSLPSSDYKEKETDDGKRVIVEAMNESIPNTTPNQSIVEVPAVSAQETLKEAQVPKPLSPAPTPTNSSTSHALPPRPQNDSASEADEEVEEINKPFLLPPTVTELTAVNGVKVYVVGTAHFSRQSQLDVIHVSV